MRDKPLILIVDDEPDISAMFAAKLSASGYEIQTAATGEEAIQKAGDLMPDLILMDVHLGMDVASGTDVALRIKQNEDTKDLKIAFLSSLKDPWPTIQTDRAALTKAMGMEEFLDKTDNLDKILARVREILARPVGPSDLRGPHPPSHEASEGHGAD